MSMYGDVLSANGAECWYIHPGIAHALAAIVAVLSTTHRSPNVSLLRVACCYCRAISSGVGEESFSQHGYCEC